MDFMWKKIRRPRPLPRQGRLLGPLEVWNLALPSLATATMASQLRKQSLWNVELGSPRCQDCKVQISSLLQSLFVCFQAKHGEERWQMLTKGLGSRWSTIFSQIPQWPSMPVISSARAARTWCWLRWLWLDPRQRVGCQKHPSNCWHPQASKPLNAPNAFLAPPIPQAKAPRPHQ